ncbi:M1 family metallopeptidase [Terriglobus roseus]|nr:M1 family metallopeptidase [Terriglobus roseus]
MWSARVFGALALATVTCSAQQQTPPADPQPPLPKGKVLFERHEPPAPPDEDPAQTAPAADPATQPKPKSGVSTSSRHPRSLKRRTDTPEEPAVESPPVIVTEAPAEAVSSSTDAPEAIVLTAADLAASANVTVAERAAPQIARTYLDLHLNSHTGEIETRAQLLVRNTGSSPMTRLPLRVSGALQWESARAANAPLKLEQHHIADDLDHTGVGTELLLTLPEPLGPGAMVALDLYYGGTITASTGRLTAMGAPAGRAASTDWDTVTDTFTGLRGLGDVLWYPVTTAPALLRNGDAVPQSVAAARIADAASPFRLDLTVEYTGTRPDAAFFTGERAVLRPLGGSQAAAGNTADGAGVVTASWSRAAMGPHTPSLFIAQAAPHLAANGLLRVVTDRADTVAALGEAATRLRPMMSEWLGAAPLSAIDVIDLPIRSAAGYSDGTLLVAPLGTAPAAALAPTLVQPVAAAWLPPDVAAAWLREGIPTFLQAVWSERSQGRAVALNGLASNATALQAQAAPLPSPTSSSSQDAFTTQTLPPLATCADPACARARAAYVFEMLRGMLGDSGLQQAISGWRQRLAPSDATGQIRSTDGASGGAALAETTAMEQMLQQVAGKRDLGWFFRSWIDAGHSLPDLSIVTVAPRRVERNAPVDYLPAKKPVGGPIGPEPVPQVGDPTYEAERKPIAPGDRIAPAVGSWLVAVEVQNAGETEAEVPVTVRAGDLTNTLPLRVPAHGRATIRVPFEADPQEVVVNDGSVPEARATTHRRSITNLPPAR